MLGPDDVRQALEQARSQGCPSLSAAADEALQGASSNRAGYSPNVGQLSQLQWKDGIGHGTLTWAGGSWDVWDYGDKLHPTGSWQKELLSPDTGDEGPEARQCLLLHCAAGYLHGKYGKVPTWEAVQKETNELRKELVDQAAEASRQAQRRAGPSQVHPGNVWPPNIRWQGGTPRESTRLLGLEGTDSGRSACEPSVVEGAS